MSERLGAVCAELAVLWPALAAALRRDTAPGTAGAQTVSSLVNADVLHAMLTLRREVPDRCSHAAAVLGEPWKRRDLRACLRAIPRLSQRLHTLGLEEDVLVLRDGTAGWLRLTKQALGLRTPDIPVRGAHCPFADSHDFDAVDVVLMAQGSEGFLRRTQEGIVVEWEHQARIYCPACGAGWGPGEWALLGQMLNPAKVAS